MSLGLIKETGKNRSEENKDFGIEKSHPETIADRTSDGWPAITLIGHITRVNGALPDRVISQIHEIETPRYLHTSEDNV